MAKRPSILISNDDGILAPGILRLIEAAAEFGDLTIVAPDSAQSGMGHAISVGKPLRIFKEELPGGFKAFACNGTPADCVKLATGVVMKEMPDLILSGINHGANSSISSIYSGTLSVAREGAVQGIPSIGFSLLNYKHEADMTTAAAVAKQVIREAINNPLAAGQYLNVNIPDLPLEQLRGFKVTRQAAGRWISEFDERVDPYGRKYYWLTGRFALQDNGDGHDEHALRDGFVSITPMTHDLTAYEHLDEYGDWAQRLDLGNIE